MIQSPKWHSKRRASGLGCIAELARHDSKANGSNGAVAFAQASEVHLRWSIIVRADAGNAVERRDAAPMPGTLEPVRSNLPVTMAPCAPAPFLNGGFGPPRFPCNHIRQHLPVSSGLDAVTEVHSTSVPVRLTLGRLLTRVAAHHLAVQALSPRDVPSWNRRARRSRISRRNNGLPVPCVRNDLFLEVTPKSEKCSKWPESAGRPRNWIRRRPARLGDCMVVCGGAVPRYCAIRRRP
jgi:hypothetical protein